MAAEPQNSQVFALLRNKRETCSPHPLQSPELLIRQLGSLMGVKMESGDGVWGRGGDTVGEPEAAWAFPAPGPHTTPGPTLAAAKQADGRRKAAGTLTHLLGFPSLREEVFLQRGIGFHRPPGLIPHTQPPAQGQADESGCRQHSLSVQVRRNVHATGGKTEAGRSHVTFWNPGG